MFWPLGSHDILARMRPGERNEEIHDLVNEALARGASSSGEPDHAHDPRGELYLKTHALVRRHLFKKTRSFYPVPHDEDLDDIVQDAFSDAFRSLSTFDSTKANFITWMCTIAIRRAYKWAQKAARSPVVYSLDDQSEDDDVPHREPSTPGHILIEEQQILREILRFMVSAIRGISNGDYRIVVSLVFFGWFTLLDLRRVLGANPNTLKSAYRRGLKELIGKISMRCGPSYEQLAVQIMETHKRGSLAKGMAVLDTDTIAKLKSDEGRRLLALMVLEEFSLDETATRLGIEQNIVVEKLKVAVDELLEVVERELT